MPLDTYHSTEKSMLHPYLRTVRKNGPLDTYRRPPTATSAPGPVGCAGPGAAGEPKMGKEFKRLTAFRET